MEVIEQTVDISYIVTGVISALVAIILALGAIVRFYMPKIHPNNKSNPNPGHDELVEIRQGIQKLNELMLSHTQMAARDHYDEMAAFERIEAKLK